MANHASPPWDCSLSAENDRHYNPDPDTYRLVPDLFDLKPEEVMLVAAHESDLQSAQKHGHRTGYVHRPLEHGPGKSGAIPPAAKYDFVTKNFLVLADHKRA